MDHLEEAKQKLDNACNLVSGLADDDARFRLEVAKVHALVSIAESLAVLSTSPTAHQIAALGDKIDRIAWKMGYRG